MTALVWLCSAKGERNAAYLISVGAGKNLMVVVVVISISFELRGQYWLSVKAVNV